MITSHNFNQAYEQYTVGLIPFRLLQDQAAVMIGLCANTHPECSAALAITDPDIQWLLQQPEASLDYSNLLGGAMFVCETTIDLKQIEGCDFAWAESHGDWPNVTEIPMTWDNCCYLDEVSGEPQWVLFLMCWNNAGGPIYYVPKYLWQIARVSEHIALSNAA